MTAPLRVLALEPYAAGSHVAFLDELARHSRHSIEALTLPARGWKWRMRTAALHYAAALEGRDWDLLLASDYVNLGELLALLPPERARRPVLVYFHENQLTYPLQPGEARDNQYAFTHLYSLLAARASAFNSYHHRTAFFDAFASLARHVPDVDVATWIARARERSEVLPLGTDLPARAPCAASAAPVIAWNHRWEYDKAPERFVDALLELDRRGEAFRVRLLGQRFRDEPPALARLRDALGARLVGDGFAPDREAYLDALAASHVHVSTARHEFFGLGTLEALRSGLFPVLPDDLAYPELVDAAGAREHVLYPPEAPGALTDALARALDTVRLGRRIELRHALVRGTDRFSWSALAPRYDAWFERHAASEHP